MKLTRLQAHVLELAVEDYTSLPSIYAAVRERGHGGSESECLNAAIELVQNLISEDYVRLYIDNLRDSTETYRDVREMSQKEIIPQIELRDNWIPELRPVPDLLTLSIGATDRGERALREYWT